MRSLAVKITIVFILVLFCGCSGRSVASPGFEPVDPGEELKESLAAVLTDFEVSAGRDSHSWERTVFFFKNHTAGYRLEQDRDDPLSFKIWNSAATDSLHFTVRKRFYRGSYLYKVSCLPAPAAPRRMSLEMAVLNARNLARFIREGQLEVSLLSGELPEGLFERRKTEK